MREILFRGKRVDNGDWVEGWFCGGTCLHPFAKTVKSSQIIDKDLFWHEVIHETVGQYTGLTDKNGNKIFEGDVVKTKFGRLCHVKWRSTGCFCGIDLIPLEAKSKTPTEWDLYCSENLEVVGNIHDNPELLEVQNEQG